MDRLKRPFFDIGGFVSILIFVVCVGMGVPLHAAEKTTFDLEMQPLESALSVFSTLTGYSILVDGRLVSGRFANAVHGVYEPESALAQLLEGTDLVVRYSGEKAFTLMQIRDEQDAVPQPSQSSPRITAAYGKKLQTVLTRLLCDAQPDAFGRYRVVFQLWIDNEGIVQQAHLAESTGVLSRDQRLLQLLHKLDVGPSPKEIAQPVTILLTPRHNPDKDCRRISMQED